MAGSQAYLTTKYNFYYVPDTYYDGGYKAMIGGESGVAPYQDSIQLSGVRTTHDLYFSVSIEYISTTQVKLHYEVASRQNQPPQPANKPTSSCVMFPSGTSIDFTTQAIDQDDDPIYYRWAFGDGDSTAWLGPYNSADNCTVSHKYLTPGSHNITVLTKDPWLTGTVWSDPLAFAYNCMCGDANGDAAIDISDVVFLIAHIFSGGSAPGPCECYGTGKAKGDANGDGAVDISDAVYLIARIFSGGNPPHCP
jgi:hypothetical protein